MGRAATAGLIAAVMIGGCAMPKPTGVVTFVDDATIEFPAVVAAGSFGRSDMAGYHLIVWEGGRAADHTLLRASVSDVQVLDALESLGAVPGNALGIDSWDERDDPAATAPDQVVQGPPVSIEFVLGDGRTLTPADVLEDDGGRGFDMRFGGHRDNIAEWHSGCVVCLYSCPGSKVGNAAYTVHDFVAGATHFRVREGVLPAEGSEIVVRFRLGREAIG